MELPLLKPMYQRLKNRGFEIVVVEIQGNQAGAEQFIAEQELPYVFVEDTKGADSLSQSRYVAFAYPTTFIIDRQGKIRKYHLGFSAGGEKKLEAEVTELLNESD